jgi:hypothetical protein
VNRRHRPTARWQAPQEIELYVDELVLSGFPPSERPALGDALTTELERLLREHLPPGLSQPGDVVLRERAVERLNAGSIALEPRAQPGQVGARVARAVYQGLSSGSPAKRDVPGTKG